MRYWTCCSRRHRPMHQPYRMNRQSSLSRWRHRVQCYVYTSAAVSWLWHSCDQDTHSYLAVAPTVCDVMVTKVQTWRQLVHVSAAVDFHQSSLRCHSSVVYSLSFMYWTTIGLHSLRSSACLTHFPRRSVCDIFGLWSCHLACILHWLFVHNVLLYIFVPCMANYNTYWLFTVLFWITCSAIGDILWCIFKFLSVVLN